MGLAWEQHKFLELCSEFADGDWIESRDQSSSGIRLIQTGNIGVNEFIEKPENQKWITEKTFDNLKCTEVKSEDILVSRLPSPAGRACIVPKFPYKLVAAVDCTIVRLKRSYLPSFVIQLLGTEKYFRQVQISLAGGTRQRISRKNLEEIKFLVPSTLNEQKKIAQVLGEFDQLITLHQREQKFKITF